ncbi:DUF5615 family PIN-like protein [bacterium]|nr:DUF5615 family PIN-like protein [bacterium]
MKFLVDESAGMAIVDYLRKEGFDVIAIAEDFPEIEDEAILSQAMIEEGIVITHDKDFGELVFHKLLSHRGIILLRLKDERPTNRVKAIKEVLVYKDKLKDAFTVITEDKIRIKKYL